MIIFQRGNGGFQGGSEQLQNIPDLRATAALMLEQANWPKTWGYKLPESLLILPELREAFPDASYVFLKRDPLSITLSKKHITAEPDHEIWQITLSLAYDASNINR